MCIYRLTKKKKKTREKKTEICVVNTKIAVERERERKDFSHHMDYCK